MFVKNDNLRRLNPRIYDTDWLMLRGMTRELRRLVSRQVRPGDRVLDFGCGDMPYRQMIEASGATYVGADFGASPDITINADGCLPIEDSSVDLVLSVQVLEHVRNLDIYFKEITRVLKPNGTLLLSTHGTWLYHPHPEDNRRWTRTGLIYDIETRALEVKEIESIVGPLGTTTMIRLTGYAFFLRRLPLIGKLLAGLVATGMNIRGWIEEKVTPEHIRFDNGCIYLTRCQRAA